MVLALSVAVVVFMDPLLDLFKLTAEAKEITGTLIVDKLYLFACIVVRKFTLLNDLCAAGDARFVMIAAVSSYG
jgi:hypothetical protein